MSQDTYRKKILVIRFSSLGDVVLTTALYPNLKNRWPNSEIHVLVNLAYQDVFNNNPYVDHVHVVDPLKERFQDLAKEIRDSKFDIIIDLQGNLKSWYLRFLSGPSMAVVVDKCNVDRRMLVLFKRTSKKLERSVRERILDCLKPIEVPLKSSETQLFPSDPLRVLNTFSIDSRLRLIGIAPGAQHKTKQWFPDRFVESANRLGQMQDSMIVFLGDKNDRAVAEKILPYIRVPCKDLIGWTSLKELIAVVSKLSFLLTNDSGILHIAEALRVPLVALFGPTSRGFGFAPYRETSRVVEATNLPCRPCSLHGDEACPLKHHKCMDDIDQNAVLFAASSVLDSMPHP